MWRPKLRLNGTGRHQRADRQGWLRSHRSGEEFCHCGVERGWRLQVGHMACAFQDLQLGFVQHSGRSISNVHRVRLIVATPHESYWYSEVVEACDTHIPVDRRLNVDDPRSERFFCTGAGFVEAPLLGDPLGRDKGAVGKDAGEFRSDTFARCVYDGGGDRALLVVCKRFKAEGSDEHRRETDRGSATLAAWR